MSLKNFIFGLSKLFIKGHIKNTYYSTINLVDMSEHKREEIYLNEILKNLEKFAPLTLAESWDNVGLLVDPMANVPIRNILLTNDLTESVVNEAIQLKTGLIISYHPNIFTGLKSVTSKKWKERIIVQCIKNNIAVFSPHTSWDAVPQGVNDWLANSLPISTCRVIKANPNHLDAGAGRLCTLLNDIKLKDAIDVIKRHVGVPYLKLAVAKDKTKDSLISTLAVCAGSGASVLSGVKADLYLTGEMSHHELLEATQNGTHVILCNHSDSERGFLKVFQKRLQNDMLGNAIEVSVSCVDKDPLETV